MQGEPAAAQLPRPPGLPSSRPSKRSAAKPRLAADVTSHVPFRVSRISRCISCDICLNASATRLVCRGSFIQNPRILLFQTLLQPFFFSPPVSRQRRCFRLPPHCLFAGSSRPFPRGPDPELGTGAIRDSPSKTTENLVTPASRLRRTRVSHLHTSRQVLQMECPSFP